MVKEGTYYKKIVKYTINEEPKPFLYLSFVSIGLMIGYTLGFAFNYNDYNRSEGPVGIFFTFMILGIVSLIINYFRTHDRHVKYERYKVQKG